MRVPRRAAQFAALAFAVISAAGGAYKMRHRVREYLRPPPPAHAQQNEGAYLVAPDVLAVVVRGGDGAKLASGPWKVTRANGSPIAVASVGRRSEPVQQPGYVIGFGEPDDLRDVVVEHAFYLQLKEPVGEREQLSVQSGAFQTAFKFDDRGSETPVIQLNQVGYHPRATKRFAYVSYWMGSAGALSLEGFPRTAELLWSDGAPPVPLNATWRAQAPDKDSGTQVLEIDLSQVPARSGVTFRIRVPKVGVSYVSRMDAAGVDRAYSTVMSGLLHNRWGVALTAKETEFVRPQDHKEVCIGERENAFDLFEGEQPCKEKRPLVGGYHDAGDFDQRPMHTVVAQLLLRAYELRPEAFTDGELKIPERGNGIPDLLDEAAWGVRGWGALQEKDGGVRAGVESYRHPWGIYFASDDQLPYYTFARQANVSARFAGIAAGLARQLGDRDAKRTAELRDAAVRAWKWAKGHGASDPYLLYGASELYRLTGEAAYRTAFEASWKAIGPEGAFNRYANEHLELSDYAEAGRVMPDYILGYLGAADANPAIRALAEQWMTREADDVAARILESEHAHRNARRTDNFAWGQAAVQGRYLDPIVARLSLGTVPAEAAQRYLDAMSLAADYALGANPAGRVYITGLGTVSPKEPLHLDSLVWIKKGKGPVPGIPVYGPASELPNNEWYVPGREAFFPKYEDSPPLYRYADVRSFVVNTEFSVWETQAPSAQHFALLHALLSVPGTPTPTP